MSLDFLHALLGGMSDQSQAPANPASPTGFSPLAAPAAAPPVAPSPTEMPDQTVQPQHDRLRQGLLHGIFGLGKTGGNILGTIGDAFLVQGGAKPLYKERLQSQQESDALEGLTDDPASAVSRLARVNPEAAVNLYNTWQDNSRLDHSQAIATRDANQKYIDTIVGRASSMVGAVTNSKNPEAAWPTVRDQMRSYFQARGIEPPFPIPDKYDPDALNNIRYYSVPSKTQVQEENDESYRGDMLNYRRDALAERANYHEGTLGVAQGRLSESERHHGVTESQGQQRINKPSSSKTPQVVQTAHGSVTLDPKQPGIATHTDTKGIKVRYQQLNGRWTPMGRIVPQADGTVLKQMNVDGKWVTVKGK
jgi:hypothetical protein